MDDERLHKYNGNLHHCSQDTTYEGRLRKRGRKEGIDKIMVTEIYMKTTGRIRTVCARALRIFTFARFDYIARCTPVLFIDPTHTPDRFYSTDCYH